MSPLVSILFRYKTARARHERLKGKHGGGGGRGGGGGDNEKLKQTNKKGGNQVLKAETTRRVVLSQGLKSHDTKAERRVRISNLRPKSHHGR